MIAIGIILYVLIALCSVRPVAGHLANAFEKDSSWAGSPGQPAIGQWAGAYFLALLIGTVWPLIAINVATSRFKIGIEKQIELEAREKRLRKAEKELELEPWN